MELTKDPGRCYVVDELEEVRCPRCKKLLFKHAARGFLETVCTRCRTRLVLQLKAGSLPAI